MVLREATAEAENWLELHNSQASRELETLDTSPKICVSTSLPGDPETF